MKTHIIAFGLLILTAIFYYSILGVLAGGILFILDPDIFSGALLGISLLLILLYIAAFKAKPNFKNIVLSSLANNGPLS